MNICEKGRIKLKYSDEGKRSVQLLNLTCNCLLDSLDSYAASSTLAYWYNCMHNAVCINIFLYDVNQYLLNCTF
jgi:hypothetical protein